MALCDVIILSKASDLRLKTFTRVAIKTLLESENPGTFNIIVCEQTEWKYNHVTTIHMPGDFNYNRFANEAIRTASSPWICVANNDLEFHRGWFSALLAHAAPVMSPANPFNYLQMRHRQPVAGYTIQEHFSGWCFVLRRSIWEQIGGFNEEFPFYCADNVVVNQLRDAGITPVLVSGSHVIHRVGATRKRLPEEIRRAITTDEKIRYHSLFNQKP